MEKRFFVYILASQRNGTLCVGITNDLVRRVYQHRTGADASSFTSQHSVHRLVYFEIFDDAENAIRREKRLKEWQRDWKIALIEADNPNWDDLYPAVCG